MQAFFSRQFSLLRAATARITDERVRTTGQVISGARVIKLNAWEPPFARLVAGVRAREVAEIARAAFIRGSNDGIFSFATVVLGCVVFLVSWGVGRPLSPRAVFTAVSLLVRSARGDDLVEGVFYPLPVVWPADLPASRSHEVPAYCE